MDLIVEKIVEHAILPDYANEGDAGMDLYACEDKVLSVGEIELVSTGIRIQLPNGTEGQIRPKSGLAAKHGITIPNSPGTIDEGYRGEVKVILLNLGKEDYFIRKGSKIAQLVIAPVLRPVITGGTVTIDTERGDGGFGSTGV